MKKGYEERIWILSCLNRLVHFGSYWFILVHVGSFWFVGFIFRFIFPTYCFLIFLFYFHFSPPSTVVRRRCRRCCCGCCCFCCCCCFVDAFSHLYKRVCSSVGWSFRRSVGRSVRHTEVEFLIFRLKWNKIALRTWCYYSRATLSLDVHGFFL